MKEDEASRRLSRLIDRYSKFEVSTLDLTEYASSAPLAWYIQEIHRSRVVIFLAEIAALRRGPEPAGQVPSRTAGRGRPDQ